MRLHHVNNNASDFLHYGVCNKTKYKFPGRKVFIIPTVYSCQSDFASTFRFQKLNGTSFIFSYYVRGFLLCGTTVFFSSLSLFRIRMVFNSYLAFLICLGRLRSLFRRLTRGLCVSICLGYNMVLVRSSVFTPLSRVLYN